LVIDVDKLSSLRIPWDSESTADWPAAELLSKLSDIAYQPYMEAEPAFKELGFNRVVPFNSATMFGYVASHSDIAVVAFRMSQMGQASLMAYRVFARRGSRFAWVNLGFRRDSFWGNPGIASLSRLAVTTRNDC